MIKIIISRITNWQQSQKEFLRKKNYAMKINILKQVWQFILISVFSKQWNSTTQGDVATACHSHWKITETEQ